MTVPPAIDRSNCPYRDKLLSLSHSSEQKNKAKGLSASCLKLLYFLRPNGLRDFFVAVNVPPQESSNDFNAAFCEAFSVLGTTTFKVT